MKVMFCISCLSYGGAEKNLLMVANGLAARGHDVLICNMNNLPTVQAPDNFVRVIDMPRFTGKTKRLRQIRFVKKLCRQEKPDVLLSFLTMPNFLAAIVGKLTGIPTIISERGDPYQNCGIASKMIYGAYNLAKGAVFQTEGAKEYFSKALQKRGTVIPNPVIIKDDSIRADYLNCKKSIAYAARFEVKQKRQDLMLRAFALVHEKHPDYCLNFYGDGPDEEQIKQLAKEMSIADSVIFNGVSTKLLKDMSASEMFVLSSDFEGIPNSLIEAMSIGLPCISTDCSPGGARMLIEDGVNGLLVPRNDERALADAICSFIENREYALACGSEAVKIRERFAVNTILDAWEQYCECVARR